MSTGMLAGPTPHASEGKLSGKEVMIVEWETPDFEVIELEAEVTAYADHWE